MKQKLNLLLISLLFASTLNSQVDSSFTEKEYDFYLMDAPTRLFTMRQFNQNYLSAYRIITRKINENSKNKKLGRAMLGLAHVVFLMPLTHEEGHRSILTGKNLGAVSKPYINEKMAYYVTGVSDQTLQNLRDSDLPNYIRLHTSGLESDYMLTNRVEELLSFEKEELDILKIEYLFRKLAILQYYVPGLLKFDIDLKEEENELDRDIVGYDTYGMARHLYRPDMPFYRYTRYKDLTEQEENLVKRMGWRSLFNLINPNVFGKINFAISSKVKMNVGMGYTTAPFGDFIDENIWLKLDNKYNIAIYFRQFQNHNSWFNGAGISLVDYRFSDKIITTFRGNIWQQPKDLDFFTKNSFTGGSAEMDFKYYFSSNSSNKFKAMSLNLGFLYKTKGFLPEELYLEEHFGIRIGTSIRF